MCLVLETWRYVIMNPTPLRLSGFGKYADTVTWNVSLSLQWRHYGRDSVSNHQPHDCFLNRLFRHRSKKTSKLRVTGLCAGNSPEAGEFPAQMASNAENASIWWRHHDDCESYTSMKELTLHVLFISLDSSCRYEDMKMMIKKCPTTWLYCGKGKATWPRGIKLIKRIVNYVYLTRNKTMDVRVLPFPYINQ